MEKLVIIKENWLRGESDSTLRIPDNKEYAGMMCCLGFYALNCGYTEEEISDQLSPGSIADKRNDSGECDIRGGISKLVFSTGEPDEMHNNKVCMSLMKYNDDENISDTVRIEKLTALFKEIDVEVEFV